jgi:TRAP-type uncharacterized transport system substrate-binding protein
VERPPERLLPATIRSRIALEMAAELVAASDQPLRQAKVLLRDQAAGGDWTCTLFASSGIEGIEAVARGEAALAMVNPANMLMLAHRGKGPFTSPLPVRTLTVIPSYDAYAFAIRADSGITSFEEIAAKRFPLRVGLRGQMGHSLHYILADVFAATGLSADKIFQWGGEMHREGLLPYPTHAKFQKFVHGELNAIFDEAAFVWVAAALEAGMTMLPLSEATMAQLEAIGYRRGYLRKADFPKLKDDVLTIDYSGWPVFVHADLPEPLVTKMCAALEARKALIPWGGEGPLPLERMCIESKETPQLVPYHPAAERFWKERGYLA